jgi:hypothetical protein
VEIHGIQDRRRSRFADASSMATTHQQITQEHLRRMPSGERSSGLLIGGLLFALGFAWMFRSWFATGFDSYFGDEGDARILISLLEHWFRFYSGLVPDWRSPAFFYPERGVLGFTDAYFLYSLPYSLFRTAGLDPFISFMAVMASLSAIGFASFMHLAIRHFGARAWTAAAGAFLFVFADMMALKMGHAQSYCAMLLPAVVDLAAGALKAEKRRNAILLAAAAGLLHALIFFTAFLTGWFFTLFCLFAALVYGLLVGRTQAVALIRYLVTEKRSVAVAYGAAFAIGILPFLLIYVPVRLDGRRRGSRDFFGYQPRFSDIINVGPGNLVWGALLDFAGIAARSNRPVGEVEMGYSPAVFATWAALTFVTARRWRRDPADTTTIDRVIVMLGVSLIAGWLVQLNYLGIRPWQGLYYLVPGASGVRTTFRAQIVHNLAASLLVVLALERILTQRVLSRVPALAFAGTLAVVMVVEQTDPENPHSTSRARQWAWLRTLPAPPGNCRVFYIVPNPMPASAPWYVHQSDAIMVAILRGIPTVNGNSSLWPRGWELQDPARPDYLEALRRWVAAKHTGDGLCGLEPRAGRWVLQRP